MGHVLPADFEPGARERPVRLCAPDGYELGAIFYDARAAAPRRVAVLHGGAGIPALRYRWFARFLAASGVPALTYDYRGVGLSRPPELRGFPALIEDWAEHDSGAAIAWLRQRFPQAELIGIAHSVGALLQGGAQNAAEQARLILVAPHTGYYGDYHPLYRLPMAALWHGLMPALTRLVGYFPARRLGLGDDIPAGVALQWASRRSPEIRPAESDASGDRTRRLLERCAALDRSALMVRFSDDAFATAAGARRLLNYYPQLSPRHALFTPADAGVPRIGHFGFFGRTIGAILWPRLLPYLETSGA